MRNTGKQIQQVPTWTQAERNKTDIPVRNTLSQLHWLHHSVNTQHRQALIANIWCVWSKNQTEVSAAPAPSYACLCVHCMTRPCLEFPSVHSLTPGHGMTSDDFQATVPTNLPRLHPAPPVSHAAVLGGSRVEAASTAGPSSPWGTPDPTLGGGGRPRPYQVNHGWPHVKDGPAYCHANYCHSQASPATGPQISPIKAIHPPGRMGSSRHRRAVVGRCQGHSGDDGSTGRHYGTGSVPQLPVCLAPVRDRGSLKWSNRQKGQRSSSDSLNTAAPHPSVFTCPPRPERTEPPKHRCVVVGIYAEPSL